MWNMNIPISSRAFFNLFLYGVCLYFFNIFDFFSRITVPISSNFAQSIIWEMELKFDIFYERSHNWNWKIKLNKFFFFEIQYSWVFWRDTNFPDLGLQGILLILADIILVIPLPLIKNPLSVYFKTFNQ